MKNLSAFLNHLFAVVLIGCSAYFTETVPDLSSAPPDLMLPSSFVTVLPENNNETILTEIRKKKPEVYQYILECNFTDGQLDYSIYKDNIHLFFYGSGGSQHLMFDSQNRLLLHIENLARKDIPGDLDKDLERSPFNKDIVYLKKMTTQQKSWYEVIVKNGTDIILYKWDKGNWIVG